MSTLDRVMNKYQRQPEHVLDLHGRTVREAQHALSALFEKNFSHVRVIVGKGLHSKTGPKLRDTVKEFLSAQGVRFAQSKIADGGEGALEVFF
jgi:DNA-nicking Smr family endonuclease